MTRKPEKKQTIFFQSSLLFFPSLISSFLRKKNQEKKRIFFVELALLSAYVLWCLHLFFLCLWIVSFLSTGLVFIFLFSLNAVGFSVNSEAFETYQQPCKKTKKSRGKVRPRARRRARSSAGDRAWKFESPALPARETRTVTFPTFSESLRAKRKRTVITFILPECLQLYFLFSRLAKFVKVFCVLWYYFMFMFKETIWKSKSFINKISKWSDCLLIATSPLLILSKRRRDPKTNDQDEKVHFPHLVQCQRVSDRGNEVFILTVRPSGEKCTRGLPSTGKKFSRSALSVLLFQRTKKNL